MARDGRSVTAMDEALNEDGSDDDADLGNRLMAEMGWWDLIDRFAVITELE